MTNHFHSSESHVLVCIWERASSSQVVESTHHFKSQKRRKGNSWWNAISSGPPCIDSEKWFYPPGGPLKENPTRYEQFYTLWAFLSHSTHHQWLPQIPKEEKEILGGVKEIARERVLRNQKKRKKSFEVFFKTEERCQPGKRVVCIKRQNSKVTNLPLHCCHILKQIRLHRKDVLTLMEPENKQENYFYEQQQREKYERPLTHSHLVGSNLSTVHTMLKAIVATNTVALNEFIQTHSKL